MDLADSMTVRIKRVYEEPADDDGYRVFVDRLWPRGLKKEQAHFDLWLKDVAPSTELRRWFGHDPAKWEEFKFRYFRELDAQSEAVAKLVALAEGRTSTRRGANARLTLVFGAKAEQYSNAAALKEYLTSAGFRRDEKRDEPMPRDDLIEQTLTTWRRHHEILLYLLEQIPEEGLAAKPAGSRGRDVARQFFHLDRVRRGWLHHHETGERPKLPRRHKGPPPAKEELQAALAESGEAVEAWLGCALRGETRPRKFGKNPVRWMGYLIAHESHHRGQIALALKQAGLKLPEKVAVGGLWGKWIFGASKSKPSA